MSIFNFIKKNDIEYGFKALLFIGFMYVIVHIILPKLTEGFHPNTKVDQPCPPNSVKCPSGDCKLKNDIYGMCPIIH